MRCAYFVNLSTTTRIEFLVPDLGNPSIKSMEIKVQARVGMGNGAKSPRYCQCLDLAL
jgi:hypothetical protein